MSHSNLILFHIISIFQEKFRREFAVRLPCLRLLNKEPQTAVTTRRGTDPNVLGHTITEADQGKNNRAARQIEVHQNNRNDHTRFTQVDSRSTQKASTIKS